MMNIFNNTGTGMRLQAGKRTRRGQSLVEFALTLPVLLTILAGTLEVANVLTIYNRVQTSAREGARFGAMGGDNVDVWNVVSQSDEGSLIEGVDRMKVWVIRPILSISGGVWSWSGAGSAPASPWGPATGPEGLPTVECVFPDDCTDTTSIPVTAAKVLTEMGASNNSYTGLNGDRFVVVVIAYETDMLLNLPWFSRTGGRFPMWSYAIMRQEVAQQAVAMKKSGCSAFPMALNYYQLPNLDATGPDDYIPSTDGGKTPTKTLAFNDVPAGYSQEIGYLAWNTARMGADDIHKNAPICGGGCPYVQGALRYPGNSKYPGYGYVNPTNPADTQMNVGDYVMANTSPNLVALGNAVMKDHIDAVGRTLRIIVYKYVAPGPDANPAYMTATDGTPVYAYKIYRFANVRVIAAETSGGDNPPPHKDYVILRFVNWEMSCGEN